MAGGEDQSTAVHLGAAALSQYGSAETGWRSQVRAHAPLEAVAALCALPDAAPDALEEMANSLMARLNADGAMAAYAGGPADAGASTLAYLLLKLAGLSADSEPLARLRGQILGLGGVQAADPYTRLLLAAHGLYPGEHLPPIPPLREWRRLPAWSRAILTSLSHLHGRYIATGKPRQTPEGFTLTELVRADRPLSDPAPERGGGWAALRGKLAGLLGRGTEPVPVLPVGSAALAPTPGWLLGRVAEGERTVARMVAASLPVRETALVLLALPEAPAEARRWLREQALPGSGWPRQFAGELHAHTEETSLALLALDGDAPEEARAWLRRQQGRQGGWAACDPDLERAKRPRLPFPGAFGDHDPACPALTGMALQALAAGGAAANEVPLRHGVEFLVREQEMRDGAWRSRWGVHYLHGTCFALRGLKAAGFDDHDAVVLRAGEWIRSIQNADGGWGESPASVERGEFVEAPSNPTQTAWALLGLVAGGDAASESVRRGVAYLLETQQPGGGWPACSCTLLHAPPALYLSSPLDAIVFPIMALCAVEEAQR